MTQVDFMRRYATIGAILMSKKVADGVRDKGGFWKHGHTYQVGFFPRVSRLFFLTRLVGSPDSLCCIPGRSKSHQNRRTVRTMSRSRRISLFSVDATVTDT